MNIKLYVYVIFVVLIFIPNISIAKQKNIDQVYIIGYIQDGECIECSKRFLSIITGLVGDGYIPNNRANLICMQNKSMLEIWKYISSIESRKLKFETAAFWDMNWSFSSTINKEFKSVVNTGALDLIIVCGKKSMNIVLNIPDTNTKFMILNYDESYDNTTSRVPNDNIHVTLEPKILQTQMDMCNPIINNVRFIIPISDKSKSVPNISKYKQIKFEISGSNELQVMINEFSKIVKKTNPETDVFILMNYPEFDHNPSNRRALIAYLDSFGYIVISHNGIKDVSCGADFGLGPNSYILESMDYYSGIFIKILYSSKLGYLPNKLDYPLKIGVNMARFDERLNPIYKVSDFVYRDTGCRY